MVRGFLSSSACTVLQAIKKYAASGALALAIFVLGISSAASVTNNNERRLAIYNIHTKETLDVVYKRDGKFIPAAMKKLNHIMRDWRRNKPTKMDPKLIDLIWELHTQLGSKKPVHLISGFRSRKTNERMRRRGGGQARNSRHIMGKAADIHFPDVSPKLIRNSALVRQIGGVGYYPTSAIPFVHVDTQGIRHWPRLPRLELAALFPNGKTRHRPRRGGPITKRDYKKAMARLSAKQKRLIKIARGEIKVDPSIASTFQVASAEPPMMVDGPKTEYVYIGSANVPPAQKLPSKPKAQPRPAAPIQLAAATLSPSQPLWGAPKAQAAMPALPQQALTSLVTANLGPQGNRPAGARATAQAPKPVAVLPQPALKAAGAAAAQNAPVTEKQQSRLVFASADPMTDLINRNVYSGGSNGNPPSLQSWDRAPSFDEDHDDELAYQPFAILPLMGELDAPGGYFEKLTPPNHRRVVAMMAEKDVLPIRFNKGLPTEQTLLASEFKGLAVAPLAMGKGSSHSKTRQYLAASN